MDWTKTFYPGPTAENFSGYPGSQGGKKGSRPDPKGGLGPKPSNNSQNIVASERIFCYTLMYMDGTGANGGTVYNVSLLMNSEQISLFARGNFLATQLVNDYEPWGTVDLIIDGNKVDSKSFSYISDDYVWSGEGKVLGEAVFNHDFSNTGNISLDFNFGVNLRQDSSRSYWTYSKKHWSIK